MRCRTSAPTGTAAHRWRRAGARRGSTASATDGNGTGRPLTSSYQETIASPTAQRRRRHRSTSRRGASAGSRISTEHESSWSRPAAAATSLTTSSRSIGGAAAARVQRGPDDEQREQDGRRCGSSREVSGGGWSRVRGASSGSGASSVRVGARWGRLGGIHCHDPCRSRAPCRTSVVDVLRIVRTAAPTRSPGCPERSSRGYRLHRGRP